MLHLYTSSCCVRCLGRPSPKVSHLSKCSRRCVRQLDVAIFYASRHQTAFGLTTTRISSRRMSGLGAFSCVGVPLTSALDISFNGASCARQTFFRMRSGQGSVSKRTPVRRKSCRAPDISANSLAASRQAFLQGTLCPSLYWSRIAFQINFNDEVALLNAVTRD